MPPIIILANGEMPPPQFLKKLCRKASAVVCADGAYAKAVQQGLFARWIVGDMDSLPPETPIGRGTVVVYDADQDCSDLEKCIKLIAGGRPMAKYAPPPQELWLLGAAGGRVDHTLAALSLTEKYSRPGLKIVIWDGASRIELISGKSVFVAKRGALISLFPLGKALVSTHGLKFPLKKEWLAAGSRGVSNRAVSRRVSVEAHRGRLWLVQAL
ncbi:MAG: thiamine diphosphokinase [Elusimicrobia bacterium RIFCSPLOWO2_12_FULL_59_9]|nr:MAG: thiamine diphosphokinase [Elusimicrobia bacterium RIFCSPLOWO2_12_FULL_59_9]